jgi:hypothetical protein
VTRRPTVNKSDIARAIAQLTKIKDALIPIAVRLGVEMKFEEDQDKVNALWHDRDDVESNIERSKKAVFDLLSKMLTVPPPDPTIASKVEALAVQVDEAIIQSMKIDAVIALGVGIGKLLDGVLGVPDTA